MIGINFQKSEVKEKYTSNISKFFNSLYLMNRGKMKPLFMGVLLVFITSCASETEYVEEVLQDCEDCPELVLIAAGKFLMGAHRNDEQVTKWEHEASVTEISNDYYIGKYEITYAQFMKCVEESSCQYIPVNLYDECKKGIFCRVDYREEKVDVIRLPVTVAIIEIFLNSKRSSALLQRRLSRIRFAIRYGTGHSMIRNVSQQWHPRLSTGVAFRTEAKFWATVQSERLRRTGAITSLTAATPNFKSSVGINDSSSYTKP